MWCFPLLPYLNKLFFKLLIFSGFCSLPLLLSFLYEVSSVLSVHQRRLWVLFIFTFFSPHLVAQFNCIPAVLYLCAVWWNHRAHIIAGGLPAVSSAADVVVLASLLHCSKYELQTSIFICLFILFSFHEISFFLNLQVIKEPPPPPPPEPVRLVFVLYYYIIVVDWGNLNISTHWENMSCIM